MLTNMNKWFQILANVNKYYQMLTKMKINWKVGLLSKYNNTRCQYKTTNVNHSSTKSQLAAELGTAQLQLVYFKLSFFL